MPLIILFLERSVSMALRSPNLFLQLWQPLVTVLYWILALHPSSNTGFSQWPVLSPFSLRAQLLASSLYAELSHPFFPAGPLLGPRIEFQILC